MKTSNDEALERVANRVFKINVGNLSSLNKMRLGDDVHLNEFFYNLFLDRQKLNSI